MYKKINYICVGQGAIRACVVTLILLIIFTGVTSIFGDNDSVKSVVYMIITCLSVLYGASYAARKAGKKGWIVGLLVAAIYSVCIYLASIGAGRESVFVMRDVVRFALALVVGTLSGMLGINL
ncbi:TIGR04086 family membrane protein [Oceanirhabdus sp. W0125-5]|uniref:TIGR04086 family membrane protein n=1 Tax=Oceanirhabdus sp. W0125-5 TaxID=2999116 RepID=UPI0022F334E9|nr:TIGR04086 family membrane protein [Oceanirhabdus sp. W0125-5]WBW99530.1 TIGR04086 family membrane protein [Oceanirhabdus sp. W0125-5]